MRRDGFKSSLLIGLLVCATLLSGCRAAEPGTSHADEVVRVLAPKPGELMHSEGGDDPSRVQDRLANLSILRDPRFATAPTEPEVDEQTGEVKVGMTFTDRSTLYLVSVPSKTDSSTREFVRYEIER
jgi:hypothetical protein